MIQSRIQQPTPRSCRLSDLPLSTSGIVESVQGPEEVRRRLLEMGFCNRAPVLAIRRAPLGDPIEFRIRGYNISLRLEEARSVWVVPLPGRDDAPGRTREVTR
jgi:Fe2+ transport system protein FeoA